MSNKVERRCQIKSRAAQARSAARPVRAAVKRYSNERRAFKLVLQPGGTCKRGCLAGVGPAAPPLCEPRWSPFKTDDDKETTGDESSE